MRTLLGHLAWLLFDGCGTDSFAGGARVCEGGWPGDRLTHVRVIDGTGAAAQRRSDRSFSIKGKIESVGDASSANVPKEAQVLDLHGTA